MKWLKFGHIVDAVLTVVAIAWAIYGTLTHQVFELLLGVWFLLLVGVREVFRLRSDVESLKFNVAFWKRMDREL